MGPSLSAFLDILEEEKIKPDEIEAIAVKVDPWANFPIWTTRDVNTCVDAQFSIAYPFAAAAYYPLPEGLGPKWQTPEVIEDTRVQRLMGKVDAGLFFDVARYPLNKPHGGPRQVKVDVTARGRTFTKEETWASQWHRDSGPTQEDLIEKFTVNASTVLPSGTISNALQNIMELEKMDTVSKLMKSLCIS
jgi:2-methylcitrate dehydratase PrpD